MESTRNAPQLFHTNAPAILAMPFYTLALLLELAG
jgi:hypothetical protein